VRTVELVLCEDTRHSRRLLDHVGSAVPAVAHHEHTRGAEHAGARRAARAVFALVSDAGTPLLSDPGARLVRAAIDAGCEWCRCPGASAVLAALVVSGLDATRFTFYGFLARRAGAA
jgi:16S rRNA (cytidine1402-2'-O)-methyltransferase